MKPLVHAHRGASGYAPENTMSAFKKAIELNADAIELDVQLTSDGHVVVIHDYAVDRTSNGKGIVKNMSLSELRELDFGSWYSTDFAGERISTLDEVFELVANTDVILNVEIKATPGKYNFGIEKKVDDLIRKYKMERKTIISSFNHDILTRYKAINPEGKIGLLYVGLLAETGRYADIVGANAVHPSYNDLDEKMITNCKEYGIDINAWTVNEAVDMEKLVSQGINGIITNFPDVARKVIDSIPK